MLTEAIDWFRAKIRTADISQSLKAQAIAPAAFAMRLLLFLLFLGSVAGNERHHGGRRRNNMLDLNRTPRRQELTAGAESLFEAIESNGGGCDLKGAWYNQHGSELILNQTEDGKLIGEFRTGVVLGARSQGDEYTVRSNGALVRGHIFGKVFTFHVYWREKNAITTWSGQCHRDCDFGWLRSDRDILHASWLITSSVDQCSDYWSATRVGEDIFTRLPMKSGPRKADEIHGVAESA